MREGLAIVVTPGNYWALVQVGWLRHVEGDEWELADARTLLRISGDRGLSQLAAEGPRSDHEVKPASQYPEPLHRLTIRRVVYADVKAWAKDCPRPEGWQARHEGANE